VQIAMTISLVVLAYVGFVTLMEAMIGIIQPHMDGAGDPSLVDDVRGHPAGRPEPPHSDARARPQVTGSLRPAVDHLRLRLDSVYAAKPENFSMKEVVHA